MHNDVNSLHGVIDLCRVRDVAYNGILYVWRFSDVECSDSMAARN
jgi:hypothetical protein